MGNLAHALKTPLSVIVNEVEHAPEDLAVKIREQAAAMGEQINYHLDRARAAALAGTLGVITEVEPVIVGLARTFTKIYRTGSGHRRDRAIRRPLSGRTAGLRGDGGNSSTMRANGPRTGSQSTLGLSKWMAGLACVSRLKIDGPGLPEAGSMTC